MRSQIHEVASAGQTTLKSEGTLDVELLAGTICID